MCTKAIDGRLPVFEGEREREVVAYFSIFCWNSHTRPSLAALIPLPTKIADSKIASATRIRPKLSHTHTRTHMTAASHIYSTAAVRRMDEFVFCVVREFGIEKDRLDENRSCTLSICRGFALCMRARARTPAIAAAVVAVDFAFCALLFYVPKKSEST